MRQAILTYIRGRLRSLIRWALTPDAPATHDPAGLDQVTKQAR